MRTRNPLTNVRHLKDSIVKALPTPVEGNKVYYDGEHRKAVKGFGVRVTAGGSRSFILNYRTRTGRERRYTIGQYPAWSTAAAREEAERLKRGIRDGKDPLAELETDRGAKTVADLCARFEEDHIPNKRPATQRDYRSMIERDILPALKHAKVCEVTFSDIDALHRKIAKGTEKRRAAPYRANRVVSLLSKAFALAERWGWRTGNPARGVERTPEDRRERYLTTEELLRLTKALAEHEDQQAANIVRLLLLTGARRGEVLSARWADFDLSAGVWTKPGATTKQKTTHRIPLSAPARLLLSELREPADEDAVYVFPGRDGEGHRADLNRPWPAICKAAKIKDLRLHDLRHSYASFLASAGLSLPIIGRLLGHTQAQTTARYAHLFDDPLRQATERVGAIVSGKPEAEVVPIKERA